MFRHTFGPMFGGHIRFHIIIIIYLLLLFFPPIFGAKHESNMAKRGPSMVKRNRICRSCCGWPPVRRARLVNGHSCECKTGWHGSNCEKKVNYCAGRPCKNSGTCTSLQTTYKCKCTSFKIELVEPVGVEHQSSKGDWEPPLMHMCTI